MNWFAQNETRPSDANGSILLMRFLGRWKVAVHDCGQTTPYTNKVWKGALSRVADTGQSVKKVLMLGLGAGGSVPIIYKKFPGAEITAVEYDPVMVSIAREIGYQGTGNFPEVVLGDAAKVIPELEETFDLIIMDLFNGPEPSVLSLDREFIGLLKCHLSPGGFFLSNVHRRVEYLAPAKTLFKNVQTWKFKQNNLGLFWDTPEGYAPPEAWPEFGHEAIPLDLCRTERVGTNPQGLRWALGPLVFEQYTSDKEPNLTESASGALARPRTIMWDRITQREIPKGWYEPSHRPRRTDGYHALRPGYITRWHKSAQRKLHTWQSEYLDSKYEIEEIPFKEYRKAYLESSIAKKYGTDHLSVLEKKLTLPSGKHIVLWGVRNKTSSQLIAGMGALYSPTYQSSMREAPFILEEAKHCHAMTGLMDHWFAKSLKQGTKLLVFTHFKQKGDPKKWSGFSDFKSHFVTGYVHNPPTLYRLRGGKFI